MRVSWVDGGIRRKRDNKGEKIAAFLRFFSLFLQRSFWNVFLFYARSLTASLLKLVDRLYRDSRSAVIASRCVISYMKDPIPPRPARLHSCCLLLWKTCAREWMAKGKIRLQGGKRYNRERCLRIRNHYVLCVGKRKKLFIFFIKKRVNSLGRSRGVKFYTFTIAFRRENFTSAGAAENIYKPLSLWITMLCEM